MKETKKLNSILFYIAIIVTSIVMFVFIGQKMVGMKMKYSHMDLQITNMIIYF